MRLVTATGIAVIMLATHAMAAGIYKWVDDQGQVHFTQTPPPNRQAEAVKPPSAPVSEEEAKRQLESLTGQGDTQRKDREFKATAAGEAKEREERLKKNCESARQNKRVLEASDRRVQVKDKDGAPRFIDDKERAAKLAESEKQIKDFCK
jgi:hypothetical protein